MSPYIKVIWIIIVTYKFFQDWVGFHDFFLSQFIFKVISQVFNWRELWYFLAYHIIPISKSEFIHTLVVCIIVISSTTKVSRIIFYIVPIFLFLNNIFNVSSIDSILLLMSVLECILRFRLFLNSSKCLVKSLLEILFRNNILRIFLTFFLFEVFVSFIIKPFFIIICTFFFFFRTILNFFFGGSV